MIEPASHAEPPLRLLICLDLRERIEARPARPGRAAPWQDHARAALQHARRAGWPIAHLLVGYPSAESARWRAISGLSPMPSEPVFYADATDGAPSAAFLRYVGHFASAELVLMGAARRPQQFDALALMLRDRAVAVAIDAISAVPRPPGWRLAAVRTLVGAGPELHLIPGGLGEEARP